MKRIRCIRGLTATLTGLAAAVLTFGGTSPAAFARPVPPPVAGHGQAPARIHTIVIHTIVTGGMPGWKITLIAAGAAVLAAAVAVVLDRARDGRRRTAVPTA